LKKHEVYIVYVELGLIALSAIVRRRMI